MIDAKSIDKIPNVKKGMYETDLKEPRLKSILKYKIHIILFNVRKNKIKSSKHKGNHQQPPRAQCGLFSLIHLSFYWYANTARVKPKRVHYSLLPLANGR